jgi:hypothetical protein
MDASGSFVVVWQSGYYNKVVLGQRFDTGGNRLGSEFQVDEIPGVSDGYPHVSASPAGEFVVVWSSQVPYGASGPVSARRYDASGAPQGPSFQVNEAASAEQGDPDVAMDERGNFTVAWENLVEPGHDFGIRARNFDRTGSALGMELAVSATEDLVQDLSPSVVVDGSGSFSTVWAAETPNFTPLRVDLRAFDAFGSPITGEIQVNTSAPIFETPPGAGGDGRGNFVVVYAADDGKGTQSIRAQRYCGSTDADGDGVCPGADNCPNVANPSQSDRDGDGRGDACELFLTYPSEGDTLDCSDPRASRPTITWDPGPYDAFRATIGWDKGFANGAFVDSGQSLLKRTSWTPSTSDWRRVCQKAAANGGAATLYFRVFGVDVDVAASDPFREETSATVTVNVRFN